MEDNNDIQDVDLENNDSQQEEESKTEPSAREKELESEVAKWKRIANKKQKESSEKVVTPTPEKEDKPSDDLDLGGIAYLNSMMGLKGKDEIALAKEYIANGKSILDLPDNKFFKQDLESLREAKAVADATPKGNKRSATSPQDPFDIAYKKYVDEGVLPENTSDNRELRERIVEKRIKSETSDRKFYNS